MNRTLDLIGRLPTTNSRIAVSLLLYVGTGITVFITQAFPGGAV